MLLPLALLLPLAYVTAVSFATAVSCPQGSRVRPIHFLRCELKCNEFAPVLLAGGRVKKKVFCFVFSPHSRVYVSALMVVVDNKILLSG